MFHDNAQPSVLIVGGIDSRYARLVQRSHPESLAIDFWADGVLSNLRDFRGRFQGGAFQLLQCEDK